MRQPSAEEVTGAQRPRVRAGALIARKNEVLLVRHKSQGPPYFLLPGGGVNYLETAAEAVVREVWEETGYRVTPGPLLWVSETIPKNGVRHTLHLTFACEILGKEHEGGMDERVAEVCWIPLEELLTLRLHPPYARIIYTYLTEGRLPVNPYLGKLWLD